jgi:uncharacterized membrane protein
MRANTDIANWQTGVLWMMLALYAMSRILQLYPEKFSILLIVCLQVASPAIFALVHGCILYRVRGMFAFCVICLGSGSILESLSLRIGFPFGHYSFTDFMGPKILQLPILLVLAYLGIGYCCWVLSLLTLGYRNKSLTLTRGLMSSLLASFTMVAWDCSMEAIWSTVDRAWIWRDGGFFFGVPLSNFLGWYFTAFLFYQGFALYCRKNPTRSSSLPLSYWRTAILCYAVCAFGNLFIFRKGLFPHSVTDASGRQWITMDILLACTLVSLLVMAPMAVFAWLNLEAQQMRSARRSESALR